MARTCLLDSGEVGHLNMDLDHCFHRDEFNLYFDWKSKTERDELPGEGRQEEQRKKAGKHPKEKEKFHVPVSRHIEVITKWKQLEEADKDLEATRRKYENQIEECRQRWREVEKRQTQLKSNLVKYNNFVKEKQGKVADG